MPVKRSAQELATHGIGLSFGSGGRDGLKIEPTLQELKEDTFTKTIHAREHKCSMGEKTPDE